MNSDQIIEDKRFRKIKKKSYDRILTYFGLSINKQNEFGEFKRDNELDMELKKIIEICYQIGHRSFLLFIPREYIAKQQDKINDIHLRFMKISTILMVEHILFFKAFNNDIDKKAMIRFSLFSFVKRVYDDLIDNNNNPTEIYETFLEGNTESDNIEYKLLAHLGSLARKYIPEKNFYNFYNNLPKAHKTQSAKPKNKKLAHLKKIAFEKAHYSFLVDSYLMVNILSTIFIRLRKKSAELFQCIDDMSDQKEDLLMNKPTYINQVNNPKDKLDKKYNEIKKSLEKYSENPILYLYLMRFFINSSIAHNRGI